ncbi:hypothetical protein C4G25_RS19870 [Vibrio parahaemolyticus]|nr:hypothetical protein [Vibrio parahaemolyticus]
MISSIPTPPERKGFNRLVLSDEEIESICKAWGTKYKYTRMFKLVAMNPGIQTHVIAARVPCNYAPDVAQLINEKLRRTGREYFLMCTEPMNLPPNGNSHHWYVVYAPAATANEEKVD